MRRYTGFACLFSFIICFVPAMQAQNKLYLVADSHLDTQWNWTVKQTIDEYLWNTVHDNLDLLEKYPDYIFNFEGSIKYQWTKEYYPEEYQRLKKYVADGRWRVSGFSVDAGDVNVPSSESLIRNFLFGQSFYKREFGDMYNRDIMLPDCFGFGYNLPSVAAHCGIVGFHTQKLTWGSAYGIPYDICMWQGVDGSQIPALLNMGAYDEQSYFWKDLTNDQEIINKINDNKKKYGLSWYPRYYGPRSDRGGAPDEQSLQWLQKNVAANGQVKVISASSDQFFNDLLENPTAVSNLPVWDNELVMKQHGVGCYTSQSTIKRWNRKNELLAEAAEKSSVMADWLGGKSYDSDKLTDAWTRVLWHHFHDDLTGTSIPKAYTYTWNDEAIAQNQFSNVLLNSVGAVTRTLNTEGVGTPIVVFNPLSKRRNEVATVTIDAASRPESVVVKDAEGNSVLSQIVEFENGKLTFLFLADVPSLGMKVYHAEMSDVAESIATAQVSQDKIENDKYIVSLDANGDISSIIDKKSSNKELLDSPVRLRLSTDAVNNNSTFPSWEILYEDLLEDATLGYVDENVKVSVAENGPLRSTLKVERTKNNSIFIQYIRVYNAGETERIDCENEVEWHELTTLLKATFSFTESNPKATFDLGLGAIERGNMNDKLYEVSGHQWADLTGTSGSYGVSVLNDCKYGWDKTNDNTIRLTLIHSPNEGGYGYQKYQDQGYHRFTYSIYGHKNNWSNADTQWEAASLNQPMLTFVAPVHSGTDDEISMASVNTDQVAIRAFKKGEDRDEYIVRIYELAGKDADNVEIIFPANIISAEETNGVEETIGAVVFEGNKLTFSTTKFKPKTFAVKLAASGNDVPVLQTPESYPVTLDYNVDVISTDNNKSDGDFCGSGLSYPAELIPAELESEGVRFTMGPTTDGENNAVACKGQTLHFNSNGNSSYLYLLAATGDNAGKTARFILNGQSQDIDIQYFTKFVAQVAGEFTTGYFKTDRIAATCTHRHNGATDKNESYDFVYIYKYVISLPQGECELQLPDDENIVIFAATVSDNANEDTKPAVELMDIPKVSLNDSGEEERCGKELKIRGVLASGQVNDSEQAAYAVDNDVFTKWCATGSDDKWLEVELEEEAYICEWEVLHAGSESSRYITSDFALQKYTPSGWIDVDAVVDNYDNHTIRSVEPFLAKKVRLLITKADRMNNAARIYEFKVYGNSDIQSIIPADVDKDFVLKGIYPNPVVAGSASIEYTVPDGNLPVRLTVWDISGRRQAEMEFSAVQAGLNTYRWNTTLPAGVYLYQLSSVRDGVVIYTDCKRMIIN